MRTDRHIDRIPVLPVSCGPLSPRGVVPCPGGLLYPGRGVCSSVSGGGGGCGPLS